MKAGLLNKHVIILRREIVEGDYRDREVWNEHYRTKGNFRLEGGNREEDNTEVFFSITGTVTLRSYVDVKDEDRLQIDDNLWRILFINRMTDSTHNHIVINVEKINQ